MTRVGNQYTGKKRKKYKIDYLRVLLIVCFVYFSVTFINQQLKINEYGVKIKSLQEDIVSAKNKVEELNETKEKINDSKYIEKVAREECGLVKPNEKIFVDVSK